MAKGVGNILVEEKQWEDEEEASRKEKEEEKRKNEKAIQEKIAELKRAITQEDLNPKQ